MNVWDNIKDMVGNVKNIDKQTSRIVVTVFGSILLVAYGLFIGFERLD
jgi:hypothetical protein